jgi:hypothetical protein
MELYKLFFIVEYFGDGGVELDIWSIGIGGFRLVSLDHASTC